MAAVVSLTEHKIRQLLGSWEDLALSQDDINELVNRLNLNNEQLTNVVDDLKNNVIGDLQNRLSDNEQVVADLNENLVPNINSAMDQFHQEMDNVNSVILPNLRADLNSGIENSLIRPQTFFSDEPPESTEDRELQISDIWHDTNDGNRQHRWDGTQWVTFTVDIADFSVTARKLISTRHLIY